MADQLLSTQGVHHIGLTVPKLEYTVKFFTDILGWQTVGENPDYPAVFVSDGQVMITLWQAQETPIEFNRKRNIGLHHLALRVDNTAKLDAMHEHLRAHGVTIEFAPQAIAGLPLKHMMCYEPSGIRVEFICESTE